MNILVLTGSPHENGTTALLTDEFCEGAKEAGHEIIRINTAKLNIKPCLGCDHCRRNDEKCVYNDDMNQIYNYLMWADDVVLVSPLYYFGMTAQLKTTIDRFHGINSTLRKSPKKLHLISVCAIAEKWAMDGLKAHYKCLCKYLRWQEGQTMYAYGAYYRKDIENTQYLQMARYMGKNC